MLDSKAFYSIPNPLDLEGCRIPVSSQGENKYVGIVVRLVTFQQFDRGRRPR